MKGTKALEQAAREFADWMGDPNALTQQDEDQTVPVKRGLIARLRSAFNADVADQPRQESPAQQAAHRLIGSKFEEAKHPRLHGKWIDKPGGPAPTGEPQQQAQSAQPKKKATSTSDEGKIPMSNLWQFLTGPERNKLRSDTARRLIEAVSDLPSVSEMASVALAGIAKRGWYEHSSKAIQAMFGVDAPRFTALLAAISPRTSVKGNLLTALNVWTNWNEAGRPKDEKSIDDILAKSVQGKRGAESVLDAWRGNVQYTLQHDDPGGDGFMLSGPKVDSFMLNLMGHMNEVTSDGWMASYALVDQAVFGGSRTQTDAGKGVGYLAMNVRTRQTADYLTRVTGEKWTPAEVQETVWSWAKALYEKSRSARMTSEEFLASGRLTDKLIADVPDFASLFRKDIYAKVLEKGGYGQKLNELAGTSGPDGSGASGGGGEVPAKPGGLPAQPSGEAAKGPGSSGIHQDKLRKAARRLDRLKRIRAEAKRSGKGKKPKNPEEINLENPPSDPGTMNRGPLARLLMALNGTQLDGISGSPMLKKYAAGARQCVAENTGTSMGVRAGWITRRKNEHSGTLEYMSGHRFEWTRDRKTGSVKGFLRHHNTGRALEHTLDVYGSGDEHEAAASALRKHARWAVEKYSGDRQKQHRESNHKARLARISANIAAISHRLASR